MTNNNKSVFIVGSSGLAREVACYVLDLGYIILGFVDISSKDDILIRKNTYPVFSENTFLESVKEDEKPSVVVAIGFPNIKRKVADKFIDKCLFPNIIHPSVQLLDDITMGIGNVIGPNTIITRSSTLGDFNFFNIGVSVGHDVKIGNFNVFNPKVSISGNVSIGDSNLFGVNSSILQNVKVGNNNVLGIGSALIRKIEDDTIQIGVPSKNIK